MNGNEPRRNESGEQHESNAVGKSPEQVDAESVSNEEFAAFMGVEGAGESADEPEDDEPTKAELWAVVKSQQETIEELTETVEDLEDTVEDQRETIKDLTATMNAAKDEAEEAKEIARSAVATAEQTRATVEEDDEEEKAHNLPGDVKPSSSPLDFFANCSTFNVKRRFVEKQNRDNRYRAIAVAEKWQEYATRRRDGSAVFWTQESIESALIEVLGEKPHRQTIKRVWEQLKELGSSDVTEKTRQVGRSQEPTPILEMSMETAEGLLENRYVGLDLLDADGEVGGVTPVVTGPTAAEV